MLATLAAILVAGYLSYNIALALYRILVHPLRSFPGPRLAAATYWYECCHDLFAGPFPGQGAFNIQRLHELYGICPLVNECRWLTPHSRANRPHKSR
jgi:hypothetical protein